MAKRILITTGGTGGHLFPAKALARAIQGTYDVRFVGASLANNPYFENEFPFDEITAASLSLRPSFSLFKNSLLLIKGVFESLKILKRYKPDLIVGFGSYHSFPILVAAIIMRKRYILHEQNVMLGRVNKIFTKFSSGLISHYPKTIPHHPKKKIFASMPLRYHKCHVSSKEEAKKKLGFEPGLDLLLVFGGSQGAQGVNQATIDALPWIKGNFQVLHLAGQHADLEKIERAYREHKVSATVKVFEKEMHKVLEAADFAIARAGASSVAELIEFEVPSILIPYPHASNHQEYNADFFEGEILGGIKLLQKEVNGSLLAKLLESLHSKDERQNYIRNIQRYKAQSPKKCLSHVIKEELESYAKG